jgi:hypothetical protein
MDAQRGRDGIFMDNFSKLDEQAMRDALHAVAVPPRLQARIFERLQQEAAREQPNAESPIGIPLTNVSRMSSTVPLEPAVRLSEHTEPIEYTEPTNTVLRQTAVPTTASRRAWMGWAMAVSAAALLFAISYWARPVSVEQLSQFCDQQLEQVLSGEANHWKREFDPLLPQLAILNGQLRADIRASGYQDFAASPLGRSCRVWNLYSNTTHKAFYLFDFSGASEFEQLTKQLRVIRSVSGGWSMAAMRVEDRVLVVLFEGAPGSYLYLRRSA